MGSFDDPKDAFYLSPPRAATEIPPYLHALTHVVRSRDHVRPPRAVKSITDTSRGLGIYQHVPLKYKEVRIDRGDKLLSTTFPRFRCIQGSCNGIRVDKEVAHLTHYRFAGPKDR